MKRVDPIAEIIKRLTQVANPSFIILFGSQARGTADPRSDFDIMVVEEHVENRFKEMVRLRRALRGLVLPIDILVISLAEFLSLSKVPGTVYYHAVHEGTVLYEAA